jgi:hypothetical protein
MNMRMERLPAALYLIFAVVLSACASPSVTTPALTPAENTALVTSPAQTPAEDTSIETAPTQTLQVKASILEALPNAEYLIELASTGKAQLKEGLFEEEAAPGSATKTKIQLGKIQAIGDVNGDGLEDAVVTLVVDPGGSGTFTYLALVLNQAGKPKPLAAVLLGDRIIVKSLALQNGDVQVTLLTRKPDEPMSTEPTVELKRIFNLQGDQLVESK